MGKSQKIFQRNLFFKDLAYECMVYELLMLSLYYQQIMMKNTLTVNNKNQTIFKILQNSTDMRLKLKLLRVLFIFYLHFRLGCCCLLRMKITNLLFQINQRINVLNQKQSSHFIKQMKKGKDNKKKELNNAETVPNKKEIMNLCRNTEDIDVILEHTHSKDDDIRLEAVKQLCPCKVLRDIDVFWNRVFELASDEDVRIRKRVMHIICDGSPDRLEDRIYETLLEFNRDKDSELRRSAHKVIAVYERTGKWNIL